MNGKSVNLSFNHHVFSYWEGDMPPIIELCVETLRAHNPNFLLVNKQLAADLGAGDVLRITEGLGPANSGSGIAHRSDMLRVWFLHKYGGTWCDADVIALRPFDLNERLAQMHALNGHTEILGFGILADDDHFSNVIFAARQGAQPLADRLKEQTSMVSHSKIHRRVLRYAQLGRPIPTTCKPRRDVRINRLPRRLFMPINVHHRQKYMSRGADDWHRQAVAKDVYSYHLWNLVVRKYNNRSREVILADDTFAAYLLRRSLQRIEAVA